MKAVRHAALLALVLGAALAARAADSAGPAPSDIIYPRGDEAATSSGATAPAGNAAAFAPAPGPAVGGLMPTVGYIIALGLLVAGAWFLVKRGAIPRPFSKNDGKLRVLETRLLGNRQFLVVVEYEDAKMLVGVCPGRIDYLTPLAGHPLAAVGGSDDMDHPAPAMAGMHFSERR